MGCVFTKDENLVAIYRSQDIPDYLSDWSEPSLVLFYEIEASHTLTDANRLNGLLREYIGKMALKLRILELRPGKSKTTSHHFSCLLDACK